jgi:D-glycero-alpha-D-manno-heptose-7-phosphate kinase
MALTLRTSSTLTPYKRGWIKITSQGFRHPEVYPVDQVPFHSPFGLFFATVFYFGFHGLEVKIEAQSPVKAALGGSSTALVALIKSLSKVAVKLGRKSLSKRDILHLAYHMEDAISGGNCGLQDHAAAVYGGIHQWSWCFGARGGIFKRTPLLDRKGQRELSEHLLVAYSGKTHISSRTNRQWTGNFLSGRTRAEWIRVNELVHHLAEAIRMRQWNRAADLLKQEMSLRKAITPEALTPLTGKLVLQAERTGCGARFAGAGAGGSLWALGEAENIRRLREKWNATLEPIKDALILDCAIDPSGVR